MPLHFAVENYLVIDEEPYVLPLLERWYTEPSYLVALVDSHQAHLFEAHAGVAEEAGGIAREIDPTIQRDKPRFTYKKRFSQTRHEHLKELTDDGFLKKASEMITEHWGSGAFGGLILLGQAPVTSAVRRLLPKELDAAVVEEAAQAMTHRPEEVTEQVMAVLERWRKERDSTLLDQVKSAGIRTIT